MWLGESSIQQYLLGSSPSLDLWWVLRRGQYQAHFRLYVIVTASSAERNPLLTRRCVG